MKSNEWYTPSKYIEAAREVMGSIDLDPASCALANETVKATKYYTKEEDGLTKEWYGNVWLNPPYGKLPGEPSNSLQSKFAKKCMLEWAAGSLSSAILLLYPDTDGKWFAPLWDFPICFCYHKVKFYSPDNTVLQHPYGTCFVYLGPHEDRFIRVFSQFGTIAKRVEVPA